MSNGHPMNFKKNSKKSLKNEKHKSYMLNVCIVLHFCFYFEKNS